MEGSDKRFYSLVGFFFPLMGVGVRGMWDLSSSTVEIEPVALALETRCLNH